MHEQVIFYNDISYEKDDTYFKVKTIKAKIEMNIQLWGDIYFQWQF